MKLDVKVVFALSATFLEFVGSLMSIPTTATPLYYWLFLDLTLALLQCLPPVVDLDVFNFFRRPSWLAIPTPKLRRLSDSSPDEES